MCQTLPPRPMTSAYKNGGEEAVWFTRLGELRMPDAISLSPVRHADKYVGGRAPLNTSGQ